MITGFVLTEPGTDRPLRRLDDGFACQSGHQHRNRDGIWDFIDPGRVEAVDAFARDYAAVRAAEQRTPLSADAVRALPYKDLSGEMEEMWAERAASFDRLLTRLPTAAGTMVDLGAGCGWLAARLADAGWSAAAVDITVDGGDGLATARWHPEELFLVRAEMNRLPFGSGSLDLVVCNASLHYAPNVVDALAEAARVTRPGGLVVVMDSPVFENPSAGEAMVAEFAATVAANHGVTPAAHFGPGFVTEADLQRFQQDHKPQSTVRIDDRSGLVGMVRARIGARRAGREIAKRPLLLFETRREGRL